MSKALLWYPWYWERWQADYEVSQLSFAEQGVYRALLDASWKQGGLPPDPRALAVLARGPLAEFKRHWKAVGQFWKPGSDGLLRNTTLEEIRAQQNTAHAKRVEAGRKGGRPPTKALLSKAKQSLAIEESRVETTLTTGAGRAAFRRRPSALTPITAVVQDVTGLGPLPPGDPPTPEQVAEFRAVKDAMREVS